MEGGTDSREMNGVGEDDNDIGSGMVIIRLTLTTVSKIKLILKPTKWVNKRL